MNYYATHARAMAATQARLGTDCPTGTWNAAAFLMVPGSAHRRQDLGSGGFSLNADLVFEALVDQFLGGTILTASDLKAAMLQTQIDYAGDSYKAQSIAIRPGGLQIMVECNSLGQNA